MKLNKFETAIIRAGLKKKGATEEEAAHILANISVSLREVAGSGAYVYINDDTDRAFARYKIPPYPDPHTVFSLSFLPDGASHARVHAYLNDDKELDFLEFFNFDGELWPETVEQFEILG